MFHCDMTCLCNKNPLGFQCHISQQLVGNNVCPNCCSKSPTNGIQKTPTAPWIYHLAECRGKRWKTRACSTLFASKLGDKDFENWSIANWKVSNPNSSSTCGTNDLPSVQVVASHESPSSSAAAKLSRSQQTGSAGPHPWHRDTATGGSPHYLVALCCLCP